MDQAAKESHGQASVSEDAAFRSEVAQINAQYAAYDAANAWNTAWAPFHAGEAAYRAQQMLTLARMMREIGRRDLAGWRILDVGCGRGRLLRSFIDMGALPADLFGTEINVAYAQDAKSKSPLIQYALTNGVTLPFAEASFDFVSQFLVLSSIPSHALRAQVTQEMWRVLKPGGYVWMWELRGLAPAAGNVKQLNYRGLFPNTNLREYTAAAMPAPSETLRMFRGAGRLGKLLDTLGRPRTHIAMLIGPK